jgi:hypothetical protein
MVLTAVHNTQHHWVSGLCPFPGIRTRERKIMFLWSRARPMRRDDNLTAICEPTV